MVLAANVGVTETVGPVGSEREVDALAYLMIAAVSLFQVVRRIRPLLSLVATTGVVLVFWVSDYAGTVDFAMWLAFYSATASGGPDRRMVWRVTGACILVAACTAVVGVIVPTEDLRAIHVPAVVLFQGTAAIIGEAAYQRRQRISLLEQRAATLEADLETKSRLAVLDERTRIAREMHDTIAHGMAAVVVQAGAGRRVVETDPTAAAQVFATIESIGHESVDEMRRMLGLLRDDDTEVEMSPQPGIDDYRDLLADASEAGVDATFKTAGTEHPLPPGVELTAYRVAQEALANVKRHAGRPVRADVTLTYAATSLILEVMDDGLGAAASAATAGTGLGLMGMTERVELYGGTVNARPRPGGGYGVTATIPLSGHKA
ncbi:MAG: sensor histidine kinase [Actinomycetia bacterium]|nr:sensor histidine kinase [Actinomycetes bacterium]